MYRILSILIFIFQNLANIFEKWYRSIHLVFIAFKWWNNLIIVSQLKLDLQWSLRKNPLHMALISLIMKQVAKQDSLKRYKIYMYYLGQFLLQIAYILFSCQDSSVMSMFQVHHFISKFLKAHKLLSFGWITQVCLNKCFVCMHFLWLGFLSWWNTFNGLEKILMIKTLYITR